AGLLLLVPGFLSDAVALALLVPPVRHALARRAGEAVMRRFTTRSVRVVRGQVIKENPAAGPDTGIRVVRAPEGEESPPR
ncbi:MAG TPA: FxsA family protein, partial [Kineosporiaceae bacterium]